MRSSRAHFSSSETLLSCLAAGAKGRLQRQSRLLRTRQRLIKSLGAKTVTRSTDSRAWHGRASKGQEAERKNQGRPAIVHRPALPSNPAPAQPQPRPLPAVHAQPAQPNRAASTSQPRPQPQVSTPPPQRPNATMPPRPQASPIPRSQPSSHKRKSGIAVLLGKLLRALFSNDFRQEIDRERRLHSQPRGLGR